MPTILSLTEHSISPASEARLSLIPREYVDGMWPHVEKMLLRSYRRADQNIPLTLRRDLRSGHRQLWIITTGDVTIVAAGVTCIFAMRSGLALKIEHLGGGSMRLWLSTLRELERYALNQGCKKLMWEGRRGWKRLIPDYQEFAVTMIKRLDNG